MDDLKHIEDKPRQVIILGDNHFSSKAISTLLQKSPNVAMVFAYESTTTIHDEDQEDDKRLEIKISPVSFSELTQKDIKRYDKISNPNKYGKHKKFDKHKF